jgi:hypothetical protein
MMEARFYLRVSGAVFGLVCLGHLLRIIFRWPLVIGTMEVPMTVSWLGMAGAGALAFWAGIRLPGRESHLDL